MWWDKHTYSFKKSLFHKFIIFTNSIARITWLRCMVKYRAHRLTLNYVHSSFICNIQNLEIIQMPLNQRKPLTHTHCILLHTLCMFTRMIWWATVLLKLFFEKLLTTGPLVSGAPGDGNGLGTSLCILCFVSVTQFLVSQLGFLLLW